MQYVGQHCNGWCETRKNGNECQCTYDRDYERQCMEQPGKVTPAFGIIPEEVLNGSKK